MHSQSGRRSRKNGKLLGYKCTYCGDNTLTQNTVNVIPKYRGKNHVPCDKGLLCQQQNSGNVCGRLTCDTCIHSVVDAVKAQDPSLLQTDDYLTVLDKYVRAKSKRKV